MSSKKSGCDLATGALIGAMLGGVVGLLAAPKSGKELREDFTEGCCKLGSGTRQLANQIIDKKEHLLSQINGTECSCSECAEAHQPRHLLLGGLVGTALGAVAAILLAPQAGEKLRQTLGDTYESLRDKSEELLEELQEKGQNSLEHVDDWKDSLFQIIDKISGAKGKGKKVGFHAEQLMEWAALGLQLLHRLQKRR